MDLSHIASSFTTPCSPCYNVFLPAFPEEDLVLKAALTPAAELWWIIEDANGIKYMDLAIVDGQGDLTIPIANFPEGLFAPHSGRFLLWLVTDLQDPESVAMTLGNGYQEDEYECVSIVFYHTNSPYLTITEIE